MILRVLVVQLDHVVIDVLDDERHLHAVLLELLELHPGHGSGGVLEEHLVDPVGDRLSGLELPADEVFTQDLVDDVVRHSFAPSLPWVDRAGRSA